MSYNRNDHTHDYSRADCVPSHTNHCYENGDSLTTNVTFTWTYNPSTSIKTPLPTEKKDYILAVGALNDKPCVFFLSLPSPSFTFGLSLVTWHSEPKLVKSWSNLTLEEVYSLIGGFRKRNDIEGLKIVVDLKELRNRLLLKRN